MTNEQRAMQVWSVLVFAALEQKVLSYTMVERLIGVPARGLAPILGAIQIYCKKRHFPPLTAIVINERDGVPGYLYPEDRGPEDTGILKAQSRVFVFDWARPGRIPSEGDLKATA